MRLTMAGMGLGVLLMAGGVADAKTVLPALHGELTAVTETAVESAAAGGGQIKDDLFAGTSVFAKGAKEVNEVNLDQNMLGMVGGKKGDMARKMDFVVVHTYEYEKPGMYRMEDVQQFRQRLVSDGSWNCFVHTQEKNESTDVCMKKGGDNETNELAVITAEPTELTFVHLKGRLSVSDMKKMAPGVGDAMDGK